jgi:uncharacterized phage protein (TIGR01671 family)
MRNIKFRVWDSVLKYMLPFGNYVAIDGGVWEEAKKTYDTPNKEIEPVKNVVLMQFTGLKDKNGKEIYEGDIIKVKTIHWLVEPLNSEERDGDNYGLCVSPNGNGENYFLDKSILEGEVIGSIYENPELLK